MVLVEVEREEELLRLGEQLLAAPRHLVVVFGAGHPRILGSRALVVPARSEVDLLLGERIDEDLLEARDVRHLHPVLEASCPTEIVSSPFFISREGFPPPCASTSPTTTGGPGRRLVVVVVDPLAVGGGGRRLRSGVVVVGVVVATFGRFDAVAVARAPRFAPASSSSRSIAAAAAAASAAAGLGRRLRLALRRHGLGRRLLGVRSCWIIIIFEQTPFTNFSGLSELPSGRIRPCASEHHLHRDLVQFGQRFSMNASIFSRETRWSSGGSRRPGGRGVGGRRLGRRRLAAGARGCRLGGALGGRRLSGGRLQQMAEGPPSADPEPPADPSFPSAIEIGAVRSSAWPRTARHQYPDRPGDGEARTREMHAPARRVGRLPPPARASCGTRANQVIQCHRPK